MSCENPEGTDTISNDDILGLYCFTVKTSGKVGMGSNPFSTIVSVFIIRPYLSRATRV